MRVISFKDWFALNEGFEDEDYAFHAVFMAGGPASGKTTVATAMFGGLGFKFSNSDFFYERLAHRGGFDASAEGQDDHPEHPVASSNRGVATRMAINHAKGLTEMRHPIVIDVTARDKNAVVSIDNSLREIGYDTFMVFVNTDLQKVIQRNYKRGEIGGASTYLPRAAGPQETQMFWHEVQGNKKFYRQLFGGNYIEVDNSQDTQLPSPGRNSPEFRNKQMGWARTAMKLLGMPHRVRNPIGAAMLSHGTDYSGKSQPIPDLKAGVA